MSYDRSAHGPPRPPNPRRNLGLTFVLVGVAVWLVGIVLYAGNLTRLLPTIPYAGSIVIALGSFLEAVGSSFMRGTPVFEKPERRRTSLVIVIPALLLFSVMLLGAALFLAENFEHQTSASRWIGSTAFLLLSIALVSALLRDLVLRFDRNVVGRPSIWPGH